MTYINNITTKTRSLISNGIHRLRKRDIQCVPQADEAPVGNVTRRRRGKLIELHAGPEECLGRFCDGQLVLVISWAARDDEPDHVDLITSVGYVYDDPNRREIALHNGIPFPEGAPVSVRRISYDDLIAVDRLALLRGRRRSLYAKRRSTAGADRSAA